MKTHPGTEPVKIAESMCEYILKFKNKWWWFRGRYAFMLVLYYLGYLDMGIDGKMHALKEKLDDHDINLIGSIL